MAEKNKGGRPRKTLTEDQMAQIEVMAQFLSQDQIADRMGMSRTTLAAIMEREPEVSVRYKRGKAAAIALVAQSLVQKAIKGDGPSAMFFLKTQAGWRETVVVDSTSSDRSMSPGGDREALDEVNSRLDRLVASQGEGAGS